MKQALFIIFLCLPFLASAQSRDSISIYFPLNNATLSPKAKQSIDDAIKHHTFTDGKKIAVIGYCDYVGNDAYNDSLSTARAQNVLAYMVAKGLKKENLRACLGKGKINRAPLNGNKGNTADRKVVITYDVAPKNPVTAEKLASMKAGDTLSIEDLFFVGGDNHLLPTSFPALENLYSALVQNPTLRVQLEGHICCIPFSFEESEIRKHGFTVIHSPDDKFRLDQPFLYDGTTLSTARAEAVNDYLVKKGIDKNRLRYVGLGETESESKSDTTSINCEMHRRVIIRVIGK